MLLILAGVTINLVLNGGIIGQAKNAVTSTEIEQEKEKIMLAYAAARMKALPNEVTAADLEEALKDIGKDISVNTNVTGEGLLIKGMSSGSTYTLLKNGTVELDDGVIEAENPSSWSYKITNGTIDLFRYNRVITDNITYVVPGIINGYPVKSVRRNVPGQFSGSGLFLYSNFYGDQDNAVPKEVVFSDGIEYLGSWCLFHGNDGFSGGVEEIWIPSSVSYVSPSAFQLWGFDNVVIHVLGKERSLPGIENGWSSNGTVIKEWEQ